MKFLSRFWQVIRHHKGKVIFFLIILGGWYLFNRGSSATATPARSVIATVTRSTLVTSISGSGQVSATTQLDVKPKVSGDIIGIYALQGQHVYAGSAIVQLDSSDARKAVRDAQTSLDSAQLSLDKLKQSGADPDTLRENALADISNAFLDLPTIFIGAEEIILKSTLSQGRQDNTGFYKGLVGQSNLTEYQKVSFFVDTAERDYHLARTKYDAVFLDYKKSTQDLDLSSVQNLLGSTSDTLKSLAQALKSEQNLLDYLSDYSQRYTLTLPALITTYKNNLRTYIGQVNGHIASLTSVASNILNAPLDIRSQELSVTQRQQALDDAKTKLADYVVRAPLTGIIAKINTRKGESASSGSVIATMITTSAQADITLNEVDVAKISSGQKATLTFDAIPELSLTGVVSTIDSLGTTSQGVVNYGVSISFYAQDERIKPGMSVSAAIITQTKADVLMVPTSAVKTEGSTHYVEIPAESISAGVTGGVVLTLPPIQTEVEIGDSNDTMTEITNGLKEGDQIIVRTIAAAAQTTTSATGGLEFRELPAEVTFERRPAGNYL